MNRKDFLRMAGLAGVTPLFGGVTKANNTTTNELPPDNCTLIPSETAGPFPLDLTANTTFFRQDIRETKTGVRLNVKLKIVGVNNCAPMQNVRVNIWHCDKDGLYSGYSQTNNAGQAGLTYLRGYQFTNANGEVEFTTIFPGWYQGRICHIHFQVYVSSSYSAISQLTFPIDTKNSIYTGNATLYTKGTDPMTLASDNIFSDGYAYQMATLTPNTTTGGYDTYLQVAVQGSGTVGVGHLEKETAKQFELGQNFPNPYMGVTNIPFTLKRAGEVMLDIWDLSGRKMISLPQHFLTEGQHTIQLNMQSLGLATGDYVYQLEVKNSEGIFRDVKMMTLVR